MCIDFLVAIYVGELEYMPLETVLSNVETPWGPSNRRTDGRFDPMIFVPARDRTEEQACPLRLPWYCRYDTNKARPCGVSKREIVIPSEKR